MRKIQITVMLDETVAEQARSLGVLDEKTLAQLVKAETKKRQWQKLKEALAPVQQDVQAMFETEEDFMLFLDNTENEGDDV
jgi:DNA-binding ferritin-like protein